MPSFLVKSSLNLLAIQNLKTSYVSFGYLHSIFSFLPLMTDDTRTFAIFIIARLFSSYILLRHFQWSGFERKLGDFQTFSGMLANVWFSSETFPERCGSGGHGEIEKLIRAVLFPLSPRVGWTKEKKNILLQDSFQIVKNIFSPYQKYC